MVEGGVGDVEEVLRRGQGGQFLKRWKEGATVKACLPSGRSLLVICRDERLFNCVVTERRTVRKMRDLGSWAGNARLADPENRRRRKT